MRPGDKLYKKAEAHARECFGDDQRDINLFLSGVDWLHSVLLKAMRS